MNASNKETKEKYHPNFEKSQKKTLCPNLERQHLKGDLMANVNDNETQEHRKIHICTNA